jgi:hypothetical protein
MVAMMANTFASRFGPAPFTKLVSEIQLRHHAEREIQYLAAAEHFGFYGKSQIPPFSAFHSSMEYAGLNISVKYIANVFIEWFNSVRIYFERVMASQGAIRLAGDHTFSVIHIMYSIQCHDLSLGYQQNGWNEWCTYS